MGFCILNKPLSQQSEFARDLDLSPLGMTDDLDLSPLGMTDDGAAEQCQYKTHIAAYIKQCCTMA